MRSLSCNNLGAAGAAALAPALAANGSLTSLNLGYNQLCGLDEEGRGTYTADGITAIADALRVNGSLTSINLSENKLCGVWTDECGDEYGTYADYGTYTAEGITAIADALRVNGSLTALDLSDNYLMDEGVSAVCKAIQSNKETKLASLNFKHNYGIGPFGPVNYRNYRIGPVGAKSVAAMVSVTGALTSIDLSGNALTDSGRDMTGITELAAALGVNGSLTKME